MIADGKFINSTQGKDMYIAVKTGAIDELSFCFIVEESEFDKDGVRNVREVSSVEEISFVTWGMDNKTRVIEINQDKTIRSAEKALKQVGFSNSESKKILANGFKSLNARDERAELRDEGLNDKEVDQVFEECITELINNLKG
jgi:hypothetical protein